MSVRFRLGALLFAVVLGTLVLAWILTGNAVIHPFTRDAQNAYIDQAVFVAEEVERGADPVELGRRLGLEVRVTRRLPRFGRGRGRGGPPEGVCRNEKRREREIIVCRAPRAPVALASSHGWVIVRRDIDFAQPGRRLGGVLILVAGLVFAVSAWLAVRLTRPLRTTIGAMERIAAGELTHRLPLEGGREFAEVARAFNRMADRIDTLLRAERELMAGISHELRTPLARLRLETELLRDHQVPEMRLTAMESDLEEVDRLIGEVLELSRLSIGERRLKTAEIDLKTVVEEALVARPLPDHVVTIDAMPTPAHGDHDRLVRVVANLIENAGKYAPAGSEVLIRVDSDGVEVLDRGPGVPEDELGRLFEPFYRGSNRRRASGLGLGLMIARQIVELHGGEIAARPRDGGGLALRFTLPRG